MLYKHTSEKQTATQQLLVLPFLRSCLLPESSRKERRGKSVVKREKALWDQLL